MVSFAHMSRFLFTALKLWCEKSCHGHAQTAFIEDEWWLSIINCPIELSNDV